MIIAIIAILAALLAPELKATRESARSLQCVNNLRQVATTLIQYANDHKKTFPLSYEYADPSGSLWNGTGSSHVNWQQYIGPRYLNEPKIVSSNFTSSAEFVGCLWQSSEFLDLTPHDTDKGIFTTLSYSIEDLVLYKLFKCAGHQPGMEKLLARIERI